MKTVQQCVAGGIFAFLFLVCCRLACSEETTTPEDPLWIWTPVHTESNVPSGVCYFRRSFDVADPSESFVEIAADDAFELFINGQLVGQGSQWKYFTKIDTSSHFVRGRNTIAVKVVNRERGRAGLAVRVTLPGEASVVTDRRWKCTPVLSARWKQTRFADRSWRQAHELGAWGHVDAWLADPMPTTRRTAGLGDPAPPRPVRAEFDDLPPESTVQLASAEEEIIEIPEPNTPKPLILKPLETFSRLRKKIVPKGQFGGGGIRIPRLRPQHIENPHVVAPSETNLDVNQHRATSEANSAVPPNSTPDAQPDSPTRIIPPSTEPSSVSADIPTATPRPRRFQAPDGFAVEHVLSGDKTGSLISTTFNEFGHALAGQEDGPLLLITDSNNDGQLDRVRPYCEDVKNCQGILALSGMVFTVAEGPDGSGLYRLSDDDADGELEEIKLLVGFETSSIEHGPHGIVLGPDSDLYVVVGNHAKLKGEFARQSPRRDLYEGDLIPRYEDPGGHAKGVRQPGGFVLRTDVNGSKRELFASGLRNPYDLAFNADGQLLTYDSDMESDETSAWYRPTRLYHVLPGGEFGWRSGWAKWPSYYPDVLPPVAETGRGSPTGMVFYLHNVYPQRYRNVAFLGDWAGGRILTAKLSPNGASYQVKTETFVEGTPLNVTDLTVGPDGMLYFCTGGRGTAGGLYRVAWNRQEPKPPAEGILRVATSPQINSSWGRQAVAAAQMDLKDQWHEQIEQCVTNTSLPSRQRLQALQAMQWVGPIPTAELLLKLTNDKDWMIRRMAAYLAGLSKDERMPHRLLALLADPHAAVRRQACESLVRTQRSVPLSHVEPLLKSNDRFEVWAARRLLALDAPDAWQDAGVSSTDIRQFLQCGVTLMTSWPTKERAQAIVGRCQQLLNGYVNDDDFLDLVRLLQLTMLRGQLQPADVPDLVRAMAEEFPATDHDPINRELVRLLVRLQAASAKERILRHLESDVPESERIHLVTHLSFLKTKWTDDEMLRLFKQLSPSPSAGNSIPGYLQNVARDFRKKHGFEQTEIALRRGAEFPSMALDVVLGLPESLTDEQIQDLIRLDQALKPTDETRKKLRVVILAILASDGHEASMAHLRNVYDQEPARRHEVIIGLLERPSGKNWDYLVRSLPDLQGEMAKEILMKLQSVDQFPDEAVPYRHVINLGLKLGEQGGDQAVRLLEHWRGFASTEETPPWDVALRAWQNWFAQTFPESADMDSEAAAEVAEKNYDALLDRFSRSDVADHGSAERGQLLFATAKCAACHQHGKIGESMGPDLSTVGKRFLPREILDAIVHPSRVISDQYKAKTLITDEGRSYTGIVGSGGEDKLLVLQADGTKAAVPADSVVQTIPSTVSAMPAGLLDGFTEQQIADLMAFLATTPIDEISENPQQPLAR